MNECVKNYMYVDFFTYGSDLSYTKLSVFYYLSSVFS